MCPQGWQSRDPSGRVMPPTRRSTGSGTAEAAAPVRRDGGGASAEGAGPTALLGESWGRDAAGCK